MPLIHKSTYLLNKPRNYSVDPLKDNTHCQLHTSHSVTLPIQSNSANKADTHVNSVTVQLSHSHTNSVTHSFSNSFFLLFINSNTHSYPHSPTQSLAHKCIHIQTSHSCIHSFIHSFIQTLTHLKKAQSLTHTHSLIHFFII
jgi:hypothetical protein